MTYKIITYGCQMNKNDSKRIAYLFDQSGLTETSEEKADFIVINSCSVRGRVIDRIRGKINQLSEDQTTILTGCVLDEEKKEFKNRFDYILDIKELPKWHKKIDVLKKIIKSDNYFHLKAKREKPIGYIPIMTGCDNFCSYCAVPYTRGREQSRNQEEIIEEIKSLTENGFKEIWLLGQNVNSYNKGKKPNFADLLRKVNSLESDFWIRFTSSHPKDFNFELVKAMKECEKVTEYLNLPIQSGDDQVLKAMNRPYSVKEYKDIIKKVRKEIPDITLSTDIIVGFPGETEKAFQNTKRLMREINYDMAYIARYSPRPQTKAAELEDDVSDQEKKRRAKELSNMLKKTALERNKSKIGETITFLPVSYKDEHLIGKTRDYKTIKVKGSQNKLNDFQKAKVIDATHFGLKGKLL